MKTRPTQAQSNPFPYSDTNKRYYAYDYYLRQTFGKKCAKIPLDLGLTCPNIDGRCGYGGCIYCSNRGSGDFAQPAALPLAEQYRREREVLRRKWPDCACIPYFQAHTNTYAPADGLRAAFSEALRFPDAVGMNIATRADCLPPDVVALLGELAEQTVLTVELGLQSSNDETAKRINRGHDFAAFCRGFSALRAENPHIRIGVHLIFGLPGETQTDMLNSVRAVAALRPDEVKLHLLHCLRSTVLGEQYEQGNYVPMERQAYIDTVIQALTLLPPTTVIGRLTGDGMGQALLAPEWSRRKVTVLNDIDKGMLQNGYVQGCAWIP